MGEFVCLKGVCGKREWTAEGCGQRTWENSEQDGVLVQVLFLGQYVLSGGTQWDKQPLLSCKWSCKIRKP